MSAKALTPEEEHDWRNTMPYIQWSGNEVLRIFASLDAARERTKNAEGAYYDLMAEMPKLRERIEELQAAIRRIEDAPGVVSDEMHDAIEHAIRVIGDAR